MGILSDHGLPELTDAAQLCNGTGLSLLGISQASHAEPDISIEHYDAEAGDSDVDRPLSTCHDQIAIYLQSAGDFIYSLAKLVDLEEPMVASPAVLARAAAEHSSRAFYLSKPGDGPAVRVSKFAQLLQASFNEHGFQSGEASQDERELANRLNRYRSRNQLPRVGRPNIVALIDAIAPEGGSEVYSTLSGVAHASMLSTMRAYRNASQRNIDRYTDTWRQILFAVELGLTSANQVRTLWSQDHEGLDHMATLYMYYAQWLDSGTRP